MLVRSPLLTNHKWRELVSSGRLVCRCHHVFLWCYVCFFLLRFRLYAFVEAAALRSIVLRHAGAPIAARVSFFLLPLVYLEMSLFPSVFCTIAASSSNGEYVVLSFLPNGVFLPRDHGLDFCVCVCVFFPFILDIKFVGRTSRGHLGGMSHRISHPPSFCGACLNFSREKDSAVPFPRRPCRILCTNDLIVLHPLGILF